MSVFDIECIVILAILIVGWVVFFMNEINIAIDADSEEYSYMAEDPKWDGIFEKTEIR